MKLFSRFVVVVGTCGLMALGVILFFLFRSWSSSSIQQLPPQLVGDASGGSRPNIIVILSDDQRFGTMDAMPFTEAFFARGTTFPRAYVSTPLCCPSRSSMLTGQYAHNHGVLGNRAPYGFKAFDDSATVATSIQEAGYTTALIGKYLNGYEERDARYLPPGWDIFTAFVGKPGYDTFALTSHVDGTYVGLTSYSAPDYSTDVLAEEAIDFLRKTPADQPFFLWFAPFAPHDPSTPSDSYVDEGGAFDNFPSFNEADVSDKTGYTQDLPLLTSSEIRRAERTKTAVFGSLAGLDTAVERLVTTLDAQGRLENTILIFMSDNGVHWGEHRIAVGKSTPYEESVHVPMYLYDGRAPQARVDERLVLGLDLAPSLLALAQAEALSSVDGTSFFDDVTRSVFLTESWGNDETPSFTSAHTDRYVLIHFSDGTQELYDLLIDPYQLQNVINSPEYQAQRVELEAELEALEDCQGIACLR